MKEAVVIRRWHTSSNAATIGCTRGTGSQSTGAERELSSTASRSLRVPFQELQGLIVELRDILVNWRVGTAFKDQQLGVADVPLHAICESSGSSDVVPPECYER